MRRLWYFYDLMVSVPNSDGCPARLKVLRWYVLNTLAANINSHVCVRLPQHQLCRMTERFGASSGGAMSAINDGL